MMFFLYYRRKPTKISAEQDLYWGIYPHRVQGFGGRGWGYVSQLLNKLRQRIKIGEVLRMILEEERLEPKRQKYHLPGVYQAGKKIGPKPDYYERGV